VPFSISTAIIHLFISIAIPKVVDDSHACVKVQVAHKHMLTTSACVYVCVLTTFTVSVSIPKPEELS